MLITAFSFSLLNIFLHKHFRSYFNVIKIKRIIIHNIMVVHQNDTILQAKVCSEILYIFWYWINCIPTGSVQYYQLTYLFFFIECDLWNSIDIYIYKFWGINGEHLWLWRYDTTKVEETILCEKSKRSGVDIIGLSE